MSRIGYGWKRHENEFKHANVDRIFIDFPSDDRGRRYTAIAACFPGDTLVLLAKGDLGFGGEIPMLRTQLREHGVTVEVCEPDKSKGSPGRKPTFDPTKEQLSDLTSWWSGDNMLYGPEVYRRLMEMDGRADNDENRAWAKNWLNSNIGTRGGRPPARKRKKR